MPRDFAILAKFDPQGRSQDFIKSVGKTDYVFSVYENDVQLNTSRQVRTVEGADKLVQGILKMILTPKGGNYEDPNYGVDVDLGVGEKLINDQYAAIRSSIMEGLKYYNQLNMNNENPDEVIGQIGEVKVVRDGNDPRSILIYISVITASGLPVQIMMPQVV